MLTGPETAGRLDEEKIKRMVMDRDAGQAASREMTVAEFLDRKQWELENKLRGLRELRENVSINFLQLGCSRVQHLFKD